MAIDQEQAQQPPPTRPGPSVHSNPTIMTILSPAQLKTSPFLPSLLTTINHSFNISHAGKPELGLHNQGDRLGSTSELLSSFSHPDSFTLIIHVQDSTVVIATASARPYLGPDTSGTVSRISPWERTSPVKEGCEEWELKLMVTAPEAQGCGLAGFMMGVVEGEVIRRRGGQGKKLRMVLCTPREVTGEFYLRKGFERDYETWRGEGFLFHIVHMSKDIGEE